MKSTNQFRFEVKSLTEAGTFEGVLSPYGNVDNGNDVVEKGAFAKTMSEHGSEIPMLWQHKADIPIGKLTLEDSDEGLRVKGELLLDLPEAQKAYLLIKAGIVKGLSIGYSIVRKTMNGAVRHLKEIRLFEGSVVTFPMNDAALISAIKAAQEGGIEHKDFNSELLTIQLHEAGYQMFSALRCALYQAAGYYYGYHDKDVQLSDAERVQLSEVIIDQFRAAYLEYLPQYLAMLTATGIKAHDIEVKAGRAISSENRGRIQSAIDTLTQLLPSDAGTATSTEDTATKSEPAPAPAKDHSAAESIIDSMLAQFRAA